MSNSHPVTYGEFPHLFLGMPADGLVDLADRHTLVTLKLYADPEVARRLRTEERLESMEDPMRVKHEESRSLLRRLQETGQADSAMDESEDPA